MNRKLILPTCFFNSHNQSHSCILSKTHSTDSKISHVGCISSTKTASIIAVSYTHLDVYKRQSLPLPTPRPICPALSPTSTIALNLILLPPVVTFVTFLTSKRASSNHCNFSFIILIIYNNKYVNK